MGNESQLDCYTCGDVGHIARDCKKEKSGPSLQKMNCYGCGKEGHLARDCKIKREMVDDNKVNCYKCGELGHISRDCKNMAEPKGVSSETKCYECGHLGHLARDCKNKIEKGDIKDVACFKCGGLGHLARSCQQTTENGAFNEQNCFGCGQAGHFSRDCKFGRGNDLGKITCYECGVLGHVARDCKFRAQAQQNEGLNGGSLDTVCYGCGESGHIARNCKNPAKKQKVNHEADMHDVKNYRCYKCGEYGHIGKECQLGTGEIKANQTMRNVQCFKCGESGHISKECLMSGNADTNLGFTDLREKLSSDLRRKISSGRLATGMPGSGMSGGNNFEGGVQLLQQELQTLQKMLTPGSEYRKEHEDVGSIIESCSRNLSNDISDLIRSSQMRYGNGKDDVMICVRLESLRPLEMVFYRKLKLALHEVDNMQIATLAQHFPKLLAFLGFNYEELKRTCIAYKIGSPIGEDITKLSKLFSEIIVENGAVSERLWPSIFSTYSVADTLIEHFARS